MSRSADFLLTPGAEEPAPAGGIPALTWVEVLRRYSNLPDVLKRVQDVLRRVEENDQTDEPGVCSTGRGGGLVPVRERLGEAGLRELAANRRNGILLRTLAERYGISLSSVKRALREPL